MLGRELSIAYDNRSARPSAAPDNVRLRVRDLSQAGRYGGISFDLRGGEVLGLAGVQGSGRDALCRTLFGAESADSGQFLIDGAFVRFENPADAVERVGYVPAERRVEGIIGGLERQGEHDAGALARSHARAVHRSATRGEPRRALDRQVADQDSVVEEPTGVLSGGNQQKVVLTKWLIAKDLKILVLDHPMRGLDVGHETAMSTLIHDLARSGIGILLIADTLEELIALSDTIVVMRDGRISGRFQSSEPPTQLPNPRAHGVARWPSTSGASSRRSRRPSARTA